MDIQYAIPDPKKWARKETALLTNLCGLVVYLDVERYRALDAIYLNAAQRDSTNQDRLQFFLDAHEMLLEGMLNVKSMAESSLSINGGTLQVSAIDRKTGEAIIRIKDFREWAERAGIKLPEWFPTGVLPFDKEKQPQPAPAKREGKATLLVSACIDAYTRGTNSTPATAEQLIAYCLKNTVPGYTELKDTGGAKKTRKIAFTGAKRDSVGWPALKAAFDAIKRD